jgi:hypothetical protein
MKFVGKSALGIATATVIATGAVLLAVGGAVASAGSVTCPTVNASTGVMTLRLGRTWTGRAATSPEPTWPEPT